MTVKKTKDYSMFKFVKCNAEIRPEHVERIKNSISIKNMLHMRPILVNSDMEVIDGQHRLKAAEELGLEIYYDKDESLDLEDMVTLNSNSRVWGPLEYLNFYSETGKGDYVKLRKFMESSSIDFSTARKILSGGSDFTKKFKKGEFVFPNPEKLEFMKDCVSRMHLIIESIKKSQLKKDKFVNERHFKHAIIQFIKKDGFNCDYFIKKIDILSDRFKKSVDANGYLQQFFYIYNYRNNDPLME